MGFLKNRQINLLNIHTSLFRFADNTYTVFGMVYFLKQGIPIYFTLLVWAFIYFMRVVIRPFSLKLQIKIGLKKSVILGTLFFAGIFPLLSHVHGLGVWLVIFMIYVSTSDTLYWLPFHAYYSAMGDAEHRGKQFGAREALTTVFTSVAPLTGGFLIGHFGFWSAYTLSAFVMILSAIPVFLMKECSPGKELNLKQAMKELDFDGFKLLLGDSISSNANAFLWPVVLFLLVGNFVMVGGIMTLELFLTAILFLVLGHYFDKGKGERILTIALILYVTVIMGRSLFVYNTVTILIFEVLAAFMICFYSSALNPIFYNLSKRSHNTLWYHFFGEVGWDIGAFLTFSAGALITFMGVHLRYVMLLALIGLFIAKVVMEKYFRS